MTNEGRIYFLSRPAARGALVVLASLIVAGCSRSSSDDSAAALSSARDAQLRAEAQLKVVQERNAALVAAAVAQKEVAQTQARPAPAPPTPPPVPTNPLPDVPRIKGDLIGQSVRGGLLAKYTFDSLDEIVSLKVIDKQSAGDRAEFKVDAVLRKEASSTKRCFAVLKVAYQRGDAAAAWTFSSVKAETLTCE